jgi:hypothetical protein
MTDFYIPKKPVQDLWYKEPWMLLVLGGPLIVVIAAITTGVIAWQGEDKVVSRDYYKQGININRYLQKDAKASELKILAEIRFDQASGKISLRLEGKTTFPESILFSISTHSAASTYESSQKIKLLQTKPNVYEGKLTARAIQMKLWHVQVEAADWRLTGNWLDPERTTLTLKALNY